MELDIPQLERVPTRTPLQDERVVAVVLGQGAALGQEEVVEGAQGEDLGVPVVEAVAVGHLHLARGQALYPRPSFHEILGQGFNKLGGEGASICP